MVWEGPNPPTEPAGYDPDNKYADPVLYLKHREAKVAEEYVKVAEAKVRPGRGGRWRRHTATAATARLLQPGATALLFTAPLPHLPCATLQLIRKKLKKCYKEAGVNYQQDCRELAHVRHEACCRCPPLPAAALAQWCRPRHLSATPHVKPPPPHMPPLLSGIP